MAATSVASSFMLKGSVASLSSAKGSINGASVAAPQQAAVVRKVNMTCRAESTEEVAAVSRRAALTLFAGAAALTLRANPAEAAYGESANVFGKRGNTTGFIPYTGEGFSLSVPSKWNPSREVEFPGTVIRYEDNFDAVNNLAVIINPTQKGSITEYGSPEEFLKQVQFLLGRQSYAGNTASEGGFDKNLVALVSVLSADKKTIDGKDYYKLSLLGRTADGNEGGTHQLITATVSDGKLYILKIQAGDKRWFKGTKKFVEGAEESFLVA